MVSRKADLDLEEACMPELQVDRRVELRNCVGSLLAFCLFQKDLYIQTQKSVRQRGRGQHFVLLGPCSMN